MMLNFCMCDKEERKSGRLLRSANETVVSTPGQAGIGVVFKGRKDEGQLKIASLLPGGPAELDGQLQVGDVLILVNGQNVQGLSNYGDLAKIILGKPGSTVQLVVQRNENFIELQLTRGHPVVASGTGNCGVTRIGGASRSPGDLNSGVHSTVRSPVDKNGVVSKSKSEWTVNWGGPPTANQKLYGWVSGSG
mmetsp:Transcript_1056/g.2051  ORF Transcript_1056/g.2051 Transcript_1056/m.2051 type:complete len:192 (-) Transcript_1056:132-707(-)|eukprot:CAMPEP_0181338060 /NCGR_PEP_ID=MMETSP1101-20121128/28420_1 /TAXON_ID=46948 /ORGANISM="Rhodomonas abbreviata, Strain Caron Lab Isolate" /LENGTH=191 /DNA_ID=CAMNT_0023448735 /DNA_START=75 /DNA_END=650 /DNA_ORIENTATION=-